MFEKYEMSFAAKVGLGAAVAELNEAGIEHVARRVSGLAADLRGMLEKVAGVTVEDHGRTLCGIVSFTVDGKDGNADRERTERLFRELCAAGYSVSVSRRTSTPIDMAGRAIDCVIRVSPHVYNTEDELRNMVAVVIDLLSKVEFRDQ
jgi:cysteine desulfurase/selenocysteine lyase